MKKRKQKIILAIVLYVVAIALKKILPTQINTWIVPIIFVLSYVVVGLDILKKAVRNIRRGKVFDENFLMSVATLGAFAIGEFPEAVAVMLFYQIGELFQSYAVDKSRKSISSLMNIRPDYANVLRENEEKKVSPDGVEIGEIIIVKPGEKIPLDGNVAEGASMLDTVALTGESVPRKVTENDEVLSGCINKESVLKIKVTKEFGESTVSKILDLVENASSKKSKSENFITKFARYYTPTVVIIAVLLAILPTIAFGNFTDWLYRSLSFLVVSCPCALVISIPLSFFGGIGGASKMGILIKGSNYLESLANTEVVVFDKTGTLTEGVFEVQKIHSVNFPEKELLEIAAHAENYSNHPIAQSVKNAYGKEISKEKIKNMQEIHGKGILCVVNEKEVIIGNEKLMNEKNVSYEKCDEIGTILYVAVDSKFEGYIVISDKIKEDSKKTIDNLKKMNIRKTVMLTGDRKNIAESVAENLKIDEVYSELLPDGKVLELEKLLENKSEKGKVCFIGDGINDSPVLAMADIGIAMGALGSDAAIEAADIVIMTDEPSKVVDGIKLSKKTMKIVKENIVFAILVKILVLVLCACGIATMWMAVFGDVGVSIIAILNSLRMLKPEKTIS